MDNTHNIYLISDSTGETLERIFMALKAQFKYFKHNLFHFSFTRTENQILKILDEAKKKEDSIILYTIVDNKLAKYLSNEANKKNIPCFGVLGDLILNFSKLLNQKATNIPSGQHELNEEYYKRIEAIQFTMNHDDGNSLLDVDKSDIIILGVSRTSKTPTSIYLANRGYKTSNVPLVNEKSIPDKIKNNPKICCIVGLIAEPNRLNEVRKGRLINIKEQENIQYTDLETIQNEIKTSKKTFQKYEWPIIDVTRKSVEETAASIIKIYEIFSNRK
tara:strand:+ start:1192 stop:2016 length:825 start_codon:yes stop_codon:yes gene_type:complete